MSKSPNKHNRLYCTAAPLNSDLTDRLEHGTGVSSKDDVKEKAKILSEEYEWDKSEALKIWSYGPENTGPNLLVDVTKGV
jgi:elongation factor 2